MFWRGVKETWLVSLKHGGSSEPENLVYACALCNRAKGSVAERILGFNDSARLHEREEMIRFGKYPSEEAVALLTREVLQIKRKS